MLQLLPFRFRFRGRTQRLLDLYRCFMAHSGTGLHPTQLSRHTGIGFAEVTRCLDGTPELFVRLPQRPDGITRYRVTSAMAAQSEEDVTRYVLRAARRENFILYALLGMLLCLFIIAALLLTPALA
ncbi:MAG: hypothetical protein ACO3Z6_11780 [Pseudomonadales bacterium]|jgi:hypothetical protein